MKKTISVVYFLFILSFAINAQDTDSVKQLWHNEVDFIEKKLKENTVDYLRGVTQSEWDKQIKLIHAKVDKCKTKHEYYYTMRYFGAIINDEHNEFIDIGVYNRTGIFKKTDIIFPVWIKTWIDGRAFVAKDYSGNIPKNSEIISVNGMLAKDIAIKQREIIPYENKFAYAYTLSLDEGDPAVWTSFANYLFCEGIKPPFVVKYKNGDSTKTITLQGLERENIYKIFKNSEGKEVVAAEGFSGVFKYLFSMGKNTIGYTKINDSIGVLNVSAFLGSGVIGFLFSGTDKGFPKKLKKFMNEIKNDGIKHLIIDIRNNPGGYEPNVFELLSYFTDEEIVLSNVYRITEDTRKYVTKITKNTYKNLYKKDDANVLKSLKIIQTLPSGSLFRDDTILSLRHINKIPQTEKFKGKTYLLTNKNCYSAAIVFADLFQYFKIGLLVGEAPGGYKSVSDGNSISVDLPYSKLIQFGVTSCLTSRYLNKKCEYLTPDIPIEPTFDEWLYDKYDALPILIEKIKKNEI